MRIAVGKFASALLLGLLISSFAMASETLALIDSSTFDSSSNQAEVASLEADMADSWEGSVLSSTALSSADELMGQHLDPEEISEAEEEVNALPIPEPAAAAILLAGLGSMGWMRYRLG